MVRLTGRFFSGLLANRWKRGDRPVSFQPAAPHHSRTVPRDTCSPVEENTVVPRSTLPLAVSLGTALLTFALVAQPAHGEQTGRMTVTVVVTGEDATRSDGEWSKGTFTYRASLTATLASDGVPSDVNPYDPDYAAKAVAEANRVLQIMQDAQRGVFHDDEDAAPPDDRYLMYMGDMGCPLTLDLRVEERLEGAYADVGGMQPFTRTFSGKSGGSQAERDLLCVGSSLILDVKDDVVYRSGLGFPEVTGRYVLHEANRGNLQARGSSRITLEPDTPVITRIGPFDNYRGTVVVELAWDFERSD
jgi:hypothetical protein